MTMTIQRVTQLWKQYMKTGSDRDLAYYEQASDLLEAEYARTR